MRCSKCGTTINASDRFCKKCGSAILKPGTSDSLTVDFPDDKNIYSGYEKDSSERTILDPEELRASPKSGTYSNKIDSTDEELTETGSGNVFHSVSGIFKDVENEIETREIDEHLEEDFSEFAKTHNQENESLNRKKKTTRERSHSSAKKEKKPFPVKAVIIILVLLIALVCIGTFVFMATNKMNEEKFTADNAKEMVNAELKIITSGEYDHDDDIQNSLSEDALSQRDNYLDTMRDSIVTLLEDHKFTVSDEQKERIRSILEQALTKSNYSIDGATQVTDENYSVTVQVKPLNLYEGLDQKYIKDLINGVVKERADIKKDRTLLYSAVLDGILDHIEDESLNQANYRGAQSTAVKVHKNENDEWKIDQSDIQKIEESLIYTDEFLGNAS